ncbi:uncharacterized protein LOC124452430 isoform X1 [Xenia sp. Carnegie-2017]|uniref:uncharacterized protein LOC124452430 isoform X1 n=2 Tax=Xenia sp. Carnegie-2017 TaxID=2897299 RepID=UPI001F046DFD|nr:uncharacterized protein LOC124452430 isoform X1 [Xenia sp. Carnegie-2017]
MARKAATKARQEMTEIKMNEKRTRDHSKVKQAHSMLNVSEIETHKRPTEKDINELYNALQSLVPGANHPHRPIKKLEDSNKTSVANDTTKSEFDDSVEFELRRCRSEENVTREHRYENNMNFVSSLRWKKSVREKMVKQQFVPTEKQVLSTDKPENVTEMITPPISDQLTTLNLVSSPEKEEKHETGNKLSFKQASDTELDHSKQKNTRIFRRHSSLPTYEEDIEHVTDVERKQKHSKCSMFDGKQSLSTKNKKKNWRSFLPILSLGRRKSKYQETSNNTMTRSSQHDVTVPVQSMEDMHTSKPVSTNCVDGRVKMKAVDSRLKQSKQKQSKSPKSSPASKKPIILETNTPSLKQSKTLESRTNLVQKKLDTWYHNALKEMRDPNINTTSLRTRSLENLLTDTEVIHNRNTLSTDTESFSGGFSTLEIPKTKVRKTRSKRNRRRERRRYYSCPNVKLVTKALNDNNASKDASKDGKKSSRKASTDSEQPIEDEVIQPVATTTVQPLEAKLSFGSTVEKREPITDFMKIQNIGSDEVLSGESSQTTIGYMKPLKLNLFYSESPSRESIHKSSSQVREEEKKLDIASQQAFAFKLRRTTSRRRKRRSTKRIPTRLSNQSTFYFPPMKIQTSWTRPTNHSQSSSETSPNLSNQKSYVNKKHYSESEDSGWSSATRKLSSTSETGVQTEPVEDTISDVLRKPSSVSYVEK